MTPRGILVGEGGSMGCSRWRGHVAGVAVAVRLKRAATVVARVAWR